MKLQNNEMMQYKDKLNQHIQEIKMTPDLQPSDVALEPMPATEHSAMLNALSDVLYYVSSQFGKGELHQDAEKFIKNIKMLAREQYMCREALEKCSRK